MAGDSEAPSEERFFCAACGEEWPIHPKDDSCGFCHSAAAMIELQPLRVTSGVGAWWPESNELIAYEDELDDGGPGIVFEASVRNAGSLPFRLDALDFRILASGDIRAQDRGVV